MAKETIYLVHASQMLTELNEKIYKAVFKLFRKNDFGFILDKDKANKTVIWLDCAAINTLNNKGFVELASAMRKHREQITVKGFGIKKSEITQMYDSYKPLQKEALMISPTDFMFTHYLLFMGLDRSEAFTLSHAFGLRMPIEFGDIILNQAKAVRHLGTDFSVILK